MKKRLATSMLIIFGVLSAAFGQQHTENKADQVLRGSGRVNSSTLGMEIQIPLGSYPGRGINLPVNLSYSSKLWRLRYASSQPAGNNPENCISVNNPRYAENSAAGWTSSLEAPFIEYVGKDSIYNQQGQAVRGQGACETNTPTEFYFNAMVKRIIVHLPSGETHELRKDDTILTFQTWENPPSNLFDGTFYAADGSNLKYVEDASSNYFRLLMPDGSYYSFENTTSTRNLSTVRSATTFTDRNGNQTTYHAPDENFPNGYWTDTLGRKIPVPFKPEAPAAPGVQTYQLPGLGGYTNVTYKFHWKSLKGETAAQSALTDFNQNLKYTGDKYLISTNPVVWGTRSNALFHSDLNAWALPSNVFNPVVLAAIELPTGQFYRFSYNLHGELERINYPTGGEERFVYNEIEPLSELEQIHRQTNRGVTNRKVYPVSGSSAAYEWTYNATNINGSFAVVTVSPDGTRSERFLHRSDTTGVFGYDNALAGMSFEERLYSAANQLISKKLTNWAVTGFPILNNSGPPAAPWHPRVTQEETIIYDAGGNGVSATTTFEYDGNLSLRETPLLQNKTRQFAFVAAGSPTPDAPVRTTETTFLINDQNYPQWVRDIYQNQNMISLTTVSVVKDGGGTIVSRSEMKYDDAGYSPNLGRGNPTTSRVWDNTKGIWNDPNAYISTRARFDAWGNQTETIDALGNSATTEYDAQQHVFPIKITSAVPDPSGQNGSNTAFETTASFDPTTGLPLTTTDANGLETRIEYDPLTLRPLNSKTFYQGTQIGSVSETVYHDEPNNYWIKSRTQLAPDSWAENIAYFDGLGRAYKSEEVNSQGNIFVEKEFDEKGRIKRVTNPFRLNETKVWTTNIYDEASRIKEVILPDGAKIRTDHGVLISDLIGVTKQITDQAGKKRKGISDALGRMIRVIEDPDGENLANDYVFDTLGHLRKTVQGEQTRYFTHDSLGRLLFAKQPEQQANASFIYTDPVTGNSQWSVRYEYDDNGNIRKTTDADGVSVTGTYDNFNRLKSRDYSDATPAVSFYYDGRGLASLPAFSKGKTTRVQSSVSETRYTAFDPFGRLLAHQQITDGRTYETAYQYDAFGKLLSETYPTGKTIIFEYNRDGDLASLSGKTGSMNSLYANAINYNSSGAIERLRLGNGRWESVLYNNRQQITEIGLGTSAADKSLLKLEYSYGAPAENNGSLRAQKISFNGLTQAFEQTYSYDDLNRLRDAKETVAGSQIWKQTFLYDRYGNRRFDAANTTTTIAVSSSITNPLIDSSTNRFSGGQGYDYDKDGNLVLDAENRRFVYDAENHLKEFFGANNNGTTPDATYYYDGDGRRVKKISSTETVVFVYDAAGQLVAEYSNGLSNQPQVSYLTQDHLGSPRIITDAVGKVLARKDFSAFGDETMTPQRTENLGYKPESVRQDYTGYQKDDETGLEYAQARYYNAAHGRFTSVDPLTASANVKNPQTFNRYSYVLNSPYKYVDPLGLISSSTGASGKNDEWMGKKCDLACRLKADRLTKADYALLQWHVANGTTLGYIWQISLENQQKQPSSCACKKPTQKKRVAPKTISKQNTVKTSPQPIEESIKVETITGNSEEIASRIAEKLNDGYTEEQKIIEGAIPNLGVAAVKAISKELAETFNPKASGGTDTSLKIDIPSPAPVIAEIISSAADVGNALIQNRLKTKAAVNLILMNADVRLQIKSVPENEIKSTLVQASERGIQFHNSAVKRLRQ